MKDREIFVRKRIDILTVNTEDVAFRKILRRCCGAQCGGIRRNVRAVFLGFALLHGGEDTAIIRKRAQFRAIRLSRSLE